MLLELEHARLWDGSTYQHSLPSLATATREILNYHSTAIRLLLHACLNAIKQSRELLRALGVLVLVRAQNSEAALQQGLAIRGKRGRHQLNSIGTLKIEQSPPPRRPPYRLSANGGTSQKKLNLVFRQTSKHFRMNGGRIEPLCVSVDRPNDGPKCEAGRDTLNP